MYSKTRVNTSCNAFWSTYIHSHAGWNPLKNSESEEAAIKDSTADATNGAEPVHSKK